MKRQISTIITSGLILIVAMSLTGCGADETNTEIDQVVTERKAVSVEATVIEPTSVDITKTFSGALTGERQADIYAKLAEAVNKIHVSEGTWVKANQIIISLDPNGPMSGLAAVRSLYLNSEKTFNKMSRLYNEGAVSESDFDAAKTAYEVNKANFESLNQLIEIRSPIAGVVTSIDVAVGEYVAQGKKVATVASVDNLRLTFSVNADQIGLFTKGAKVTVTSDLTEQTASGKVVSSAGSANTDTRAFEVEAIIDNTKGHFRPGMFVHVDYLAETVENAIVIDRASIIIIDDRPVAFTIKNGIASLRPLVLGKTASGKQIVTSGLSAGDTLVTIGQAYLSDGTAVNISRVNGR